MPDSDSDGVSADDLTEAALRPKKSTGDSGSLEERSADEIIALDRYAATKRAQAAGTTGFRLRKIDPGGAA